jgi:hypothetical protein
MKWMHLGIGFALGVGLTVAAARFSARARGLVAGGV